MVRFNNNEVSAVRYNGTPLGFLRYDNDVVLMSYKTAYGKTVTLNDSRSDTVKMLKLFGSSSQDTLSGKNLLARDSRLGFANASENTVFTDAPSYNSTIIDCNKHGRTFYFSCDDFAGYNSNSLRVGYSESFPTAGTAAVRASNIGSNKTITVPDNMNYLYVGELASSSNGLPNSMLEAGNTKTDYEPYCGAKPSPNLDYPIDIISADTPTVSVGDTSDSALCSADVPFVLRSVGSVRDELILYSCGSGKLIRNTLVKQYTLRKQTGDYYKYGYRFTAYCNDFLQDKILCRELGYSSSAGSGLTSPDGIRYNKELNTLVAQAETDNDSITVNVLGAARNPVEINLSADEVNAIMSRLCTYNGATVISNSAELDMEAAYNHHPATLIHYWDAEDDLSDGLWKDRMGTGFDWKFVGTVTKENGMWIFDNPDSSYAVNVKHVSELDLGNHFRIEVESYLKRQKPTGTHYGSYILDIGSLGPVGGESNMDDPNYAAVGFYTRYDGIGVNWKMRGNGSNPGLTGPKIGSFGSIPYDGQWYENNVAYFNADKGNGYDTFFVDVNGRIGKWSADVLKVTYNNFTKITSKENPYPQLARGVEAGGGCSLKVKSIKIYKID